MQKNKNIFFIKNKGEKNKYFTDTYNCRSAFVAPFAKQIGDQLETLVEGWKDVILLGVGPKIKG